MMLSEKTLDLTVVILTFNEELHIRRAVQSAWKIAKEVIIVDSYSTDKTLSIATELKARTFQHPFVNQAQQFQWAMDQSQITTTWTMRLDADEYLSQALIEEIHERLTLIDPSVSGIVLKRQVHFMGKWIRYGGYYPIHLLRIWRTGHAVLEQRWMDEHTKLLKGISVTFKHDFIDNNLNSLTWWTSKHNDYATREAIDILNRKFQLSLINTSDPESSHVQKADIQRWYKNNLYLRMPLFLRAFLYFQFRYWIRLGVLDGRKGLVWHFLQAFWYRFLVDAKIFQIEWWSKTEKKSVKKILEEKFNFTFQNTESD